MPRDLVNTFINSKLHPIRPTVLIYNCTWVCDAKCEMCNNWKCGDRKSDMTLAQLEPAMAHPFWGAVENLNISGGEPTTRNDLPEMVRAVPPPSAPPAQDRDQHHRADAGARHPDADAGSSSSAPSKGVLISIRVSLDGIGDIHDQVRHGQERLRQGVQDDRGDAGAGGEARRTSQFGIAATHLRDQHAGRREHPRLGAHQEPRRRVQHAAVHRRDAAQQGARGEDRRSASAKKSSCGSSSSTACRRNRC